MSITDTARTRLAALRDTARDLTQVLERLRSFGHVEQDVALAAQLGGGLLRGIGDLVAEIDRAGTGEDAAAQGEAARADFAGAITSLAGAMVTAQRNLDRASIQYSREREGDAARMPTSFRIPKLTAGFHFSIDRMSEDGVNLLLWHSSKETRERNQQSVSFDIVAVPPTPEFVATIADRLPQARLLATRALREPWLAQLRSQQLATMPALWEDSVLLAEVPRSGGDATATDVLAGYTERPRQPGRIRLGVWRLTRTDSLRKDALVELNDYDAQAKAHGAPASGAGAPAGGPPHPVTNTQLLHDLLLPWCEAQAAFLALR